MLTVSKLSMRYGAKILFKNVSLQFHKGQHYGLVGANGCGKSTFLKILSAEITPESGDISMPSRSVLGSLKQDHFAYDGISILDTVLMGNKALFDALKQKENLLKNETFNDADCLLLTSLEKTIETESGYSAESDASEILEGLGIATSRHHEPINNLSGGYKLRALLAQVLFSKPDVLLLDEPTNHLDLYSIKWLETYLKSFKGTILLTSHDREFLNSTCSHIADVDLGTIKIYPGNFDAFEKQKESHREQTLAHLENLHKRKEDLNEFIERFGAKATKAKQAQSKAKIIQKIDEEVEANALQNSSRIAPKFQFTLKRASGLSVIRVKEMTKEYGPEKKVLHDVSFEIERGEKVALIGPNGIGKSTLLEIVTNHSHPTKGTYEWGFETQIAYFPQDISREVKGNESLLEWLSQFDRDATTEQLRSLLGAVLFSGDDPKKSIATLSGGETARLLLAKIMLQKANVLIFDEPTNHLDIEAIDALLEACLLYTGTLIFVSHNRYFVSKLASRIIEISQSGTDVFWGTYNEFLEKKEKDHLNRNLTLSRRREQSHPFKTMEKESNTEAYEERKKNKSIIASLKKKIDTAENTCHLIENELSSIEATMAKEGYYTTASREEQNKLLKRKEEVEANLLSALNNWEKLSLELTEMQ